MISVPPNSSQPRPDGLPCGGQHKELTNQTKSYRLYDMKTVNTHEAKTHLSRLIELAVDGEEIIIARAGKPVARLIPYVETEQVRTGGQWKGLVRVGDDFDDALPGDVGQAFGVSS